jgi:hypothetical protein
VAWLGTAFLLIFALYSSQLTFLTSGLSELLSSMLGTVFPAYPFLALLLLLTVFRWKDFHRALLTTSDETGVRRDIQRST